MSDGGSSLILAAGLVRGIDGHDENASRQETYMISHVCVCRALGIFVY